MNSKDALDYLDSIGSHIYNWREFHNDRFAFEQMAMELPENVFDCDENDMEEFVKMALYQDYHAIRLNNGHLLVPITNQ